MQIKVCGVWKNSTITVDTLILNLKSTSPDRISSLLNLLNQQRHEHYFIDEAVSLRVNTTIRNNQYRDVVDIYYREKKFGYFLVGARNSYQKKEIFPLYVYNDRLYQSGWNETLVLVMRSLQLNFHSVSALHIALDAVGLSNGFIKMLDEDSLHLNTKVDPVGTVCDKTKRLRADRGIKLGSDKSNWRFSFYQKSKEYECKRYIQEFHEQNGIDTEHEVDRCELRLNNSELCKLEIDVKKLDDTNYLIGVFSAYADSKLCFRDTSQFHYENNNKIFKTQRLIEFDGVVVPIKKKHGKGTEEDSSVKSKKVAVKQMVMDYVDEPTSTKFEYIRDYISRFSLGKWVTRKHSFWFGDGILTTQKKSDLILLFSRKKLSELYWHFWRATAWTSFAWILIAA